MIALKRDVIAIADTIPLSLNEQASAGATRKRALLDTLTLGRLEQSSAIADRASPHQAYVSFMTVCPVG
ncbi:MAG: hypothetical protein H7Z43_08395 [Clostridia bacterium]|nr:hypothetical protein [Deltaproteobacteria bacterium]